MTPSVCPDSGNSQHDSWVVIKTKNQDKKHTKNPSPQIKRSNFASRQTARVASNTGFLGNLAQRFSNVGLEDEEIDFEYEEDYNVRHTASSDHSGISNSTGSNLTIRGRQNGTNFTTDPFPIVPLTTQTLERHQQLMNEKSYMDLDGWVMGTGPCRPQVQQRRPKHSRARTHRGADTRCIDGITISSYMGDWMLAEAGQTMDIIVAIGAIGAIFDEEDINPIVYPSWDLEL